MRLLRSLIEALFQEVPPLPVLDAWGPCPSSIWPFDYIDDSYLVSEYIDWLAATREFNNEDQMPLVELPVEAKSRLS
jgi:hypothetical protein